MIIMSMFFFSLVSVEYPTSTLSTYQQCHIRAKRQDDTGQESTHGYDTPGHSE